MISGSTVVVVVGEEGVPWCPVRGAGCAVCVVLSGVCVCVCVCALTRPRRVAAERTMELIDAHLRSGGAASPPQQPPPPAQQQQQQPRPAATGYGYGSTHSPTHGTF